MNKFRVITAQGQEVPSGYVLTRIATNEYWDLLDVTEGEYLVVRKVTLSGDRIVRIMPPEVFGVGIAFNGGPRFDEWNFRPDWAFSESVGECLVELRRARYGALCNA